MVSWEDLTILGKNCLLLLLILLFPCISIAFTEYKTSDDPFGNILLPTADNVSEINFGADVILFPPGVNGKIAFPFINKATILFDAGLLIYPPGVGGSTSLKLIVLEPTSKKWGIAIQLQSLAGIAFWGGEGGGGIINAVEFIISSPIKSNRVNFGFVFHTMPGSEFKPGWEKAKKYDFKNPQSTVFASFEHTGKRFGIFSENIIAAIGADEGWDSAFASILGCKISLKKIKLKIGTGIAIKRLGTTGQLTLPLPPIISVSMPI